MLSLPSEPPEVKITRVSPSGAISTNRDASRTAGSEVGPMSVGVKARRSICSAAARLISPRPWPTWTFQRLARPSM